MFDTFKQHLYRYLPNEEIEQLVAAFSQPRMQGLLLNTDKLNAHILLEYFPSLVPHPIIPNAYLYDPDLISPGKHFLFTSGGYYLQDLSAMLVSHLLDIQDDELVADLCAAPGGKVTQAAFKAKKAFFIANDISGLRAKAMATNIERFGFDHVVITNHDALDLLNKAPYQFDKIILDAPCSGSGMFRKREDMIADWSLNKVLKFQALQFALMLAAYDALAAGGELIYSTCSFSYEENEDVINHLLNQRDAQINPIPLHPSFDESPSIKGAIHLFPHHYEGDGHFICKIKKPGSHSIHPLKRPVLTKFGIFPLSLHLINHQNYYFGVNAMVKLPFNVIRAGIFLGTIEKGIVDYNHHLALSLPPSLSFPLNEKEKDLYLRGESLKNMEIADGYSVVSYQGINLGFVKSKNGTMKNHYPKGLRLR